MALYVNKNDNNQPKEVSGIYRGRRIVSAVYKGTRLIWQYIKSCFGRGYWINDKEWSNKDAWANEI